MTKNVEIIYTSQPSSEEIQALYDGIATHAQLKKTNRLLRVLVFLYIQIPKRF